MTKTILNEVFELLHSMKVVSSESEFSKDWFGRSECYLLSLRFKGTTGPTHVSSTAHSSESHSCVYRNV